MSNAAAKEFFDYIGADQARMREISTKSPEQLVSYAKDNGFDVTLESLKSSVQEIQSASPSTQALEDTELEKVAGGVGENAVVGIIGAVGIVGQILFPGTPPAWRDPLYEPLPGDIIRTL
ncbi:nif11-like leader peptide domain protein [Thiorhodovibrio winogradskyi]|uniref:Nif11-like leader peptide domain protein n=1 Tax=Thiorhodovibrio winogradskyi TaxID=77007 RepID=A0ABZ0S632_9GAMM|nr:Nif11-like leader peptide family RiPP precursor [Thiorhodovibrio winogradskyi]